MKNRLRLFFLLLFSLSALWGDLPEVFYGICYDKQGKELFTEEHKITKVNGTIKKIRTLFFQNAEKNPMAIAESLFHQNSFLPNVYFHRFKDSFTSRAVQKGNEEIILLKKEGEKPYYFEKNYGITKDMVVGHGFYFYMIDNMQTLLENPQMTLPVQFLLPNKLAKYIFKMSATKDPENTDQVIFTLKTQNVLLRLLVPTIVVKLNQETKRMISYEGPNTFFYGTKDIFYVKIIYTEMASKIGLSAGPKHRNSSVINDPIFNNMGSFMTGKYRKLSRCPNPIFETISVYHDHLEKTESLQ
ncbi:MAG: hypothetical protein AB7N99_06480 [Simkaniaceae bacterium]